MCWTIRDVHARKLERAPAVVAAAGVKLRGVIRESERVSGKEHVESNPCGLELAGGFLESLLCDQHVGETPADFRIAARKCRDEQPLRLVRSTLGGVDLGEVHTGLH